MRFIKDILRNLLEEPHDIKKVTSWKLGILWFGLVVGFTIGFVLGSIVTGFFKSFI